MNNDLMFSSKTCEWYTPQDFFDKLDEEFKFNLDPCATDENRKCDKYFTKAVDGLKQSWQGYRVYVNPPYGRTIGDWVKKSYEESRGGGCLVVMLIPARTDTKWFHDYIYHKAKEIRFIKGRLKFGGCKNPAPFPSMLVVYDDDYDVRRCTNCGHVMTSGYVVDDGLEYFCCDDCLNGYYSKKEYEELCQNDRAYWTEWE